MNSYPDFVEKCGYGHVQGIGGANCRHSFWPYIEGVSERTYTDAQLEGMKPENRPKTVFEGREYDDYQATQKQRQIERTIRKLKRRKTAFEAAGLKEDALAAGSRLRILNQKYREFSKAAGLPEQRERMKVQYVDDVSLKEAADKIFKKPADKYEKNFTMSANSGIMTEKDIYALNQYKSSGVAYKLNAILRGEGPMTEEYRQITHDIDQALLKLPKYQGIVYRSIRSEDMVDAEAFWKRYVQGEFVREDAFVSSSTGVHDPSMDIQMIIRCRNGRDMREYNPMEQEILFRRGTMFFVEKREGNTLWLTEV